MLNIIGTPIGNLNDLSYRQAQTLAAAEIILAEDTRSLMALLSRVEELFHVTINPSQKRISYYKEKEFEKLPQIMDWLEAGKDVALVSDAGMPVISDPGYLLIKTVIKRDLPYTVIPGPSAVITALLHSGFNPQQFMFVGFLPKKKNELIKLLRQVKEVKDTLSGMLTVAFESPNRINETLAIIAEILPNAEVCVTRELTKKFEEVLRGKALDLQNNEFRGEITIVLA